MKLVEKPAAVSGLLDGAFKAAGLNRQVRRYEALAHWEAIVGKELARVARPLRIARGKLLIIEVVDAAWNQELTLMKPLLLEKLHELRMGAVIEDIKVVTGNPRETK